MRRVVVTGLGLVSPVGCGVETAWSNIIAGKSGASLIEHFDVSDLACKVAAVIPRVDGRAGGSPELPGVFCLLYTSPSPRDLSTSRMPSSA